MRSPREIAADIELRENVLTQLASQPQLDYTRIRIVAKNGAVALSGFVTSHAQKLYAVEAAERAAGVRAVADDIEVVRPRSVRHGDAELAEGIARARRWGTAIPATVDVEVTGGRVTLRGTVDWSYQRDNAARAVGQVRGVRSVANLIEVEGP